MRALAEVIERIEWARPEDRRILIHDHLDRRDESERSLALGLLSGQIAWPRLSPTGLSELIARAGDPTLFALSLDRVTDPVETLALLWADRNGRPPALAEIAAQSRDLVPDPGLERIAAWLDGLDAPGRRVLLAAMRRNRRALVTPTDLGHAPAATVPAPILGAPQELRVAVLYLHRGVGGRIEAFTAGLAQGADLRSAGQVMIPPGHPDRAALAAHGKAFAADRRGPVVILGPDSRAALAARIAIAGIAPSSRHRLGFALVAPRLIEFDWRPDPQAVDRAETLALILEIARAQPL